MTKIKAAVVGVGNIGSIHADIYSTLESVDLTAVCDTDKERADKAASKFNCKAFYSVESLLAPDLVEGKAKFMILPFNTHMNMFIAMSVHPLVSLYDHKVKQGVDATKYINALKEMRESIETFAKGIPGNMRCSGTYYIAQITLALRDRPFGEMFKKMENKS